MPIYAYKCSACGHAKDVLQKISDDPLTQCPACHADVFSKQVTAAGFQLKGSGWYATDFKGGSNNTTTPAAEGSASTAGATTSTDASGGSSSASESSASAATSATTASVASCGASCACH